MEVLAKRYPQLVLPIREGMSQSDDYKKICLRCEETDLLPVFKGSEDDFMERVSTPAGEVEIIYLADRDDFVHAYQALAYRCEPVDIPRSTGAVTLLGLNNIEKVRALDVPVSLADKSAYKDVVILLSRGPYSNVSAKSICMEEELWLEKSFLIRKNHELTHFMSRKLFPQNKEEIRDEVLADMVGILSAFGHYDTHLARLFLGIESEVYRQGGRLQNYVKDESIDSVIARTNALIDLFERSIIDKEPFDILIDFEKEKLGI